MPLRTLYLLGLSALTVIGLGTCLTTYEILRGNETEGELREFSPKMQEWLNRLQGRPLHGTAAAARLKAMGQRDRMAAQVRSHPELVKRIVANTPWTSIGPQPAQDSRYGKAGGRATAIAVDPTNDNVVFVGTSGGGVWGTTDGGQSWMPLTDSQGSLAIGSLAIDPTNHLTIYAGTGEEDFSQDSYYGVGILKSLDGGNTWTLVSANSSGMYGTHIGSIAVNPQHPNELFATQDGGTDPNHPNGIISSSDGGATWATSFQVAPGQLASSVVFDPSGNAFAGIGSQSPANGATNTVVKLAAGSTTWTATMGSTGGANLYLARRFEIAIAPSAPNFIYVAVARNDHDSAQGTDLLALLVSKDGFNTPGVFYAPPNTGSALNFCPPACYYALALAVDPANPTHLFAGGTSTGYTANGYAGANQLISIQFNADPTVSYSSITSMSTGTDGSVPHPDFHGFAISSDGQKFYAANDGGVWQLNNYNSNFTWTSLSGTLDTIEFYHLSLDQTNLLNGFGGSQDNGLLRYQGNTTWQQVTCGDGTFSAVDPTNSNNVYAACAQTAGFSGVAPVVKSTDGGSTFNSASNGISGSDTANYLAPLAMDPSNPMTLYYGTNHVYRSSDGAGTWISISCDLGDPSCANPSTGDVVTVVAVAPVDPNTVWAGTMKGLLWVTHDATSTSPSFVPVSIPASGNAVKGIAIDPANVRDVFISLSGFAGSRVVKTQDGTTFVDATGGLPAIPMNGIVFDPDLPNTLYVASDVGVFFTTDSGATWNPLGSALPNVAVRAIAFHRSARTLRVATNGRGMWQMVIPLSATPDFAFAAGALSATSVSPGGSATSTLTVTSSNGFNGAVQLSCSVSPTPSLAPTCSFSQSSVTPSPGGSATSTLTINTIAPRASVAPPAAYQWRVSYALLLLLPAMLLGTAGIPTPKRRMLTYHLFLLIVLGGCLSTAACGGSNSFSSSGGGGGTPGTPSGQYTITINATAGSIMHQQALTLTVQ